MDNASMVVRKNKKDKEDFKPNGMDSEEVIERCCAT